MPVRFHVEVRTVPSLTLDGFSTVFDKLFRRNPQPLTGVPPVRRQKSYSAATGYVYQYYYAGQRALKNGTEFVFEVSADRKTWSPVAVFLAVDAVRAWEQRRSRTLTSTERYAVAKMALFQAFDERPRPASLQVPVAVRAADAEGILSTLGID